MILGLTPLVFIHTLIGLVGIATGPVVLYEMRHFHAVGAGAEETARA